MGWVSLCVGVMAHVVYCVMHLLGSSPLHLYVLYWVIHHMFIWYVVVVALLVCAEYVDLCMSMCGSRGGLLPFAIFMYEGRGLLMVHCVCVFVDSVWYLLIFKLSLFSFLIHIFNFSVLHVMKIIKNYIKSQQIPVSHSFVHMPFIWPLMFWRSLEVTAVVLY